MMMIQLIVQIWSVRYEITRSYYNTKVTTGDHGAFSGSVGAKLPLTSTYFKPCPVFANVYLANHCQHDDPYDCSVASCTCVVPAVAFVVASPPAAACCKNTCCVAT